METKRNIFIAFILNFTFSIFELIGGFITGSVAISADALHDFFDAISIGTAYIFEKTSRKKPTAKYTYGYARFSVLGGLITTFLLLLGSGFVIYKAVRRMITPTPINYNGTLLFAVVGLVVNATATYFTHGGKSINQKAVNLHMLEDVCGWFVVLIGAVVMKFTDLYIIDPILCLLVAVFIIVNCIKNLGKITDIFLIKTPKNIHVNELIERIKNVDGVIDVHHIHIWSLDGETHCATLHIVAKGRVDEIKADVKEELKYYGILHTTVETETLLEKCTEKTCEIKGRAHCCHHHRG